MSPEQFNEKYKGLTTKVYKYGFYGSSTCHVVKASKHEFPMTCFQFHASTINEVDKSAKIDEATFLADLEATKPYYTAFIKNSTKRYALNGGGPPKQIKKLLVKSAYFIGGDGICEYEKDAKIKATRETELFNLIIEIFTLYNITGFEVKEHVGFTNTVKALHVSYEKPTGAGGFTIDNFSDYSGKFQLEAEKYLLKSYAPDTYQMLYAL